MASRAYFKNFPIIEYGSKIARNLIARPRLKESVLNNPLSYYNYVIEHDQRPDQVAANYYDDPELVWLVFLANNIVDPYYQWPLTEKQLIEHIETKYGSVATAKTTVLHYVNQTTGTIISKDSYDLTQTWTGDGDPETVTTIDATAYTPVYAYNFEVDENDAKRNIKLIDYRVSGEAAKKLKEVMNV